MPFVSMANAVPGTIASSSEYNKVVANVNQLNNTRTKYKKVAATTGTHTVTTSVTDVPGASVSVTTIEANTVVKVTAVFDVAGTADTFIGTLVVNGGAAEAPEAHLQGGVRVSITQTWLVTLATATTHTLKLQMTKIGAAGTVSVFGPHTCIVAEGQGIS